MPSFPKLFLLSLAFSKRRTGSITRGSYLQRKASNTGAKTGPPSTSITAGLFRSFDVVFGNMIVFPEQFVISFGNFYMLIFCNDRSICVYVVKFRFFRPSTSFLTKPDPAFICELFSEVSFTPASGHVPELMTDSQHFISIAED